MAPRVTSTTTNSRVSTSRATQTKPAPDPSPVAARAIAAAHGRKAIAAARRDARVAAARAAARRFVDDEADDDDDDGDVDGDDWNTDDEALIAARKPRTSGATRTTRRCTDAWRWSGAAAGITWRRSVRGFVDACRTRPARRGARGTRRRRVSTEEVSSTTATGGGGRGGDTERTRGGGLVAGMVSEEFAPGRQTGGKFAPGRDGTVDESPFRSEARRAREVSIDSLAASTDRASSRASNFLLGSVQIPSSPRFS